MSGALGAMAIGANAMSSARDRAQSKIEAREADKRQLDNSKALSVFQKNLELEQWKNTGYRGQMKEMNALGLNAAMMYGNGGNSGQLGSGASSGQGTMPNMPESYKISPMEVANLGLVKAQKEKLEAETDDLRANVPVKGEQARKDLIENNRREYADKDGKSGLDVQREQEIANINWTKQSVQKMKDDVKNVEEGLAIDWKNAKSNEDKNRIYEEIEKKKMELEMELFERGMSQRQIEFTVNKVFEGVDKIIDIRTMGASNIIENVTRKSDGSWSKSKSTSGKR